MSEKLHVPRHTELRILAHVPDHLNLFHFGGSTPAQEPFKED